jgi:acyl-CoA thioesterase FadM
METPTLTRIDNHYFELRHEFGCDYIRISHGGERVTLYSWVKEVADLRVHQRLVKDKQKALECYFYQIEKMLSKRGLSEDQIRMVVEEVRRRLEK